MKRRLIMNLQLFGMAGMSRPFLNADGGAGTGGTGADGGNGADGDGGTNKTDGDTSFDDVLKDKKYQSEFDKRVQKALETARGKWDTEYQSKIEQAKTEAEKIAKMNADQKAKYEEEKRVKDLEERERAITTRELKAQAQGILAEKKLPQDLVDILNYNNAEDCNKSIESLEKIWTKAQGSYKELIDKEVDNRIRGKGAPKGGQGSSSTSTFGFNFTGVRPKK